MTDTSRSAQSVLVRGCSTSSSGLPQRYWPNGAPGTTSTAWCPACRFSQFAALTQYGGIWLKAPATAIPPV